MFRREFGGFRHQVLYLAAFQVGVPVQEQAGSPPHGEIDKQQELVDFARAMETAATATIESGAMTGDLARLADPPAKKICSTIEFIEEVAKTYRAKKGHPS